MANAFTLSCLRDPIYEGIHLEFNHELVFSGFKMVHSDISRHPPISIVGRVEDGKCTIGRDNNLFCPLLTVCSTAVLIPTSSHSTVRNKYYILSTLEKILSCSS